MKPSSVYVPRPCMAWVFAIAGGCYAGPEMAETTADGVAGSGGAQTSAASAGADAEEPGPTTAGPADPMGECGEETISPLVLRRLTKLEYALTVQELLALEAPPSVAALPEDPQEQGFRTVATLNGLSAQHVRAYLNTAESLSTALMADPVRRATVLGCDPAEEGCLSRFVEHWGRLAWRRPLEAAEIQGLVDAATEAALDEDDAFAFALEAMLVSPHFLFRVEGSGEPGALVELGPYELASRLSFSIWGRGPDEALLGRAEAGDLDDPQGLAAVAAEMLADPRSERFYEGFFEQWLGFESLRAPAEPPPGWSDAFLEALRAQTHELLRAHAWDEDAAFFDVLTADESPASPELAAFLGLERDPSGTARPPAGDPRQGAGLLGHPALLSLKTDGDLIAKRGAWLRKVFLCQVFEVPPGLFETLGDELVGLSYQQILEKRNQEDACAGCHAMIDPVGVIFSGFDELGVLDPEADPTRFGIEPALPGVADGPIDSLAALSQALRDHEGPAQCLTDRIFLYTQGRDPARTDACLVEAARDTFDQSGRFRDLLYGVVTHDHFRWRRNPE